MFVPDQDTVDLDDVEVLREGGLAILCRIGAKEVWVPKAQMLNGTRIRTRGDRGRLVVPRWFALDQGLIA
jgi:hypothetical protein